MDKNDAELITGELQGVKSLLVAMLAALDFHCGGEVDVLKNVHDAAHTKLRKTRITAEGLDEEAISVRAQLVIDELVSATKVLRGTK